MNKIYKRKGIKLTSGSGLVISPKKKKKKN